MNWKKYSWGLIILLLSCSLDQPAFYTTISRVYDFSSSDFGWQGDFADYPEGDSTFFELQASYELLPAVLLTTKNPDRHGLYISGNNHSDDLFMFYTGQLAGLNPNTTYEILLRITIASNEPKGSVGAGGAPGESVYVKAGATTFKPMKVLSNGNYVMNLDKGNQSEGGANMVVIGNIAVATGTTEYKEIIRNNSSANPITATTDSEGKLWLIVGTDSGYEGITSIYYTKVQVFMNEF